MKILLIHNHLRPPSGENTVFEAERLLLSENQTGLIVYEENNLNINKYSFIGKCRIPVDLIWSLKSFNAIKQIIKHHKPDIAHFHNIFPLISPSAYYACKEEGVSVVQTLHNHKLFCPGGYFLRSNIICKDCVDKNILISIKYGCYKKSKIQTAGFATMLSIHRALKTWTNKVDCYIALTNFAKELYSNAGLPSEKIVIKPNFIYDLRFCRDKTEEFGIFIGRLGVEKGVDILLNALAKIPAFSFKLVGDGPQRADLDEIKKTLKLPNVEFHGFKTRNDTMSLLSRASFIVLPSVCYEGFPMVILEAMSLGKPIITTNLGGFPEIVKDGYNGFLVPPGDIEALAEKIKILADDYELCNNMGQNAREEYEKKYTPEKNYETLMAIYTNVLRR